MLANTKGFLTIWHGLEANGRIEWERWHTVEHMPERVGIPGFLAGRRYMNDSADGQCCFTLYEADAISVFNSAAYLERLNNPTPWTTLVAGTFRKLTRGACRRVATAGCEKSYGGAILTLQLLRNENFREDDSSLARLQQIADEISEIDAVTEINIGLSDAEITKTETKERALRKGTGESSLDGVLAIEGYDANLLKLQANTIDHIVRGSDLSLSTSPCQIHTLSYILLTPD
jgi:hypothetical protein